MKNTTNSKELTLEIVTETAKTLSEFAIKSLCLLEEVLVIFGIDTNGQCVSDTGLNNGRKKKDLLNIGVM